MNNAVFAGLSNVTVRGESGFQDLTSRGVSATGDGSLPSSNEASCAPAGFSARIAGQPADIETVAGNPAQTTVARKLRHQLLHGFQGCSEAQHEAHLDQHLKAEGQNHNALSEVFNDPSFLSVLGSSTLMSKESIDQEKTLGPEAWNRAFCGAAHTNRDEPPAVRNVCLHKETPQAVKPEVSFDVDSFLGFASSLGVARKGIFYQPSPHACQNLTTDVHFGLDVSDPDPSLNQGTSSSFAMLRDAPHCFFGRIVGAENATVHIFFPYLEMSPGTSVLSASQLTRWTDQVLYPAIHSTLR